uniref:Alpha-soluble NSF attachment protein n=1 Tax=Tetraselmis sp. GSL018 TaxID=582737 RepID=A0A061S826_9CHLO|mmetsp:Transcript_20975/g.50063  ORF Transcript_20975/g.50063 Transcript_20975/m.50063 type:complete len:290 (+) Transcript_20975:254-1123(+)
MSYETKGRELVAKANKKLKGWGLFGSKYEDAVELLDKAFNQFKLGKAWKEAAETCVQLTDVHAKLDSQHEVASCWVEAASCYKKISASDAIRCLIKAEEAYEEMGRLQMAARQYKSIAELQEEQGHKDECLKSYARAADLFDGENSTSESNKCRLKVAHISADKGNYDEAIKIFEDIARQSVDSNLLKYSAKGYLLNAGICHLARGRKEDISNAVERYKDIDMSFDASRECKLLEDLAAAMENGDSDAFTTAVSEFDSLTRLDPWKTSLLLAAKKLVQKGAEAEEEDLT